MVKRKLRATLVKIDLLVMIMTKNWLESLSFAQKQRLQFIEAMLIWDGSVQRADVCKVFDVTPNHLTRDIKRYRTCHKDALEYDVERRAYKRGHRFSPLLASGSAEEYLALLQAYSISQCSAVLPAMGCITHAESIPSLRGNIEPDVLRLVMSAVRNATAVKLTYQSFSGANPGQRVLWPHTLVFTGERWHIRAFDDKRQAFRDFVLARCTKASGVEEKCPIASSLDAMWHERETVEVVPAPRLSATQQAVIAREFGMAGTETKCWSMSLRKCLVGYFFTKYRLEHGGSPDPVKATTGQHPYLALRDLTLAEKYRFSED